jgi:hypothetical protein
MAPVSKVTSAAGPNPAAIEFAAAHLLSERGTFQPADALKLPFEDAT